MPESPPLILQYQSHAGEPLSRIGPFNNLLDAELAKARLCDEGIAASLAGENLSAVLGPVYGAAYSGGPYVLVPAADAADARAIIDSIEAARRIRADALTPPCPRCSHRPTNQVLHGLRWAAVVVLAVSMLTPMLVRVLIATAGAVMLFFPKPTIWKCPACRYRFGAPVPVAPLEDDNNDDDDAAPIAEESASAPARL